MTVREIADKLNLKFYTGEKMADKNVCGCYIGDLLSLAMSKVESENIWITIQTNVNIVAVASLTEASCIILAEGCVPDEQAQERANEQDVIILGGDLSAFEMTKKLVEMGI